MCAKCDHVQEITGTVSKVEKFGVFIAISNSLLKGLAHISELSDDFVKDPNAQYAVGQAVRAVVLRTDEAKGRVSLGMKASYFVEDVEDPLLMGDAGGSKQGAISASHGADHACDDNESLDLEDVMVAAYAASEDESSEGSSKMGGSDCEIGVDKSARHATGGEFSGGEKKMRGLQAESSDASEGSAGNEAHGSIGLSSNSSSDSSEELHDGGVMQSNSFAVLATACAACQGANIKQNACGQGLRLQANYQLPWGARDLTSCTQWTLSP
jgi:hypothetical protein